MKLIRIVALAVVLFTGFGIVTLAFGQARADPADERQRIADARGAAEARYGERRRECLKRFVVTACVEDAKRERRETLSRLRLEQNQLDDNLRKARAAERREEIRKRAAAEAQRQREAAARPPREPAPRSSNDRPHRIDEADAPASAAASRVPRKPRARESRPTPQDDDRSAQEARSRATFDAAQRAADAHRAEIEARNAQRAESHKRAAPLPLPRGASAP